ncbi:hypothetical protein ES703_67650 [subsurface metagenome]
MGLETVLSILGIAVLVAAAFFAFRRFQMPKAGTRRLAMTVWAAFGSYETAEDAEGGLRRACHAVLGDRINEHETWMQGHIKNFNDWEADDRLCQSLKMMRRGLLLTAYGKAYTEACRLFKEQAIAECQGSLDWLNKDVLRGHKIEVVRQEDGTPQLEYKQIWSDEKIKKDKRELGEAVYNQVGNNLLQNDSPEAKELLAFLATVYEANMDKNMETAKDVGIIWFTCLQLQDKDPDSEIAELFSELNDAWQATIPDSEEEA